MTKAKSVLQLLKDVATVLDRVEGLREDVREVRAKLDGGLGEIQGLASETRERVAALESSNDRDRSEPRLEALEASVADVRERLTALETSRRADLAELKAALSTLDNVSEKIALQVERSKQLPRAD